MRVDTCSPIKNIFLNPLTTQKVCDETFGDIFLTLERQETPSQEMVRPDRAFGFNTLGLFGIGFAAQSGAEITTSLSSIAAAPSTDSVLEEVYLKPEQGSSGIISNGMLGCAYRAAQESEQAPAGIVSFDNIAKSEKANNVELSNKNIDYLLNVRLALRPSRITVGHNFISEIASQNENYSSPAYLLKNGVDQKLLNLKAVGTRDYFGASVLNRSLKEPSKFFREVATHSSQVSVTVSNVNGLLYVAASSAKISEACMSRLRILVDEIAYDYGAHVGEFFLNGVSINKYSKLTQGGYSWQFQR